jgi:hypothetical protein
MNWIVQFITQINNDFVEFHGGYLTSFFHTLYLWTVACLSSLSINFANFFVCFSIPS